jgi:hypothetical protein
VKLKKCKLPGSDHIPEDLIQVGGETLLRFTNSLILFELRKNCLISGRSLLFYQSTKMVIKLAAQLSCDVTAINLIQNCIQYHSLKFKSIHIWIHTYIYRCADTSPTLTDCCLFVVYELVVRWSTTDSYLHVTDATVGCTQRVLSLTISPAEDSVCGSPLDSGT